MQFFNHSKFYILSLWFSVTNLNMKTKVLCKFNIQTTKTYQYDHLTPFSMISSSFKITITKDTNSINTYSMRAKKEKLMTSKIATTTTKKERQKDRIGENSNNEVNKSINSNNKNRTIAKKSTVKTATSTTASTKLYRKARAQKKLATLKKIQATKGKITQATTESKGKNNTKTTERTFEVIQ